MKKTVLTAILILLVIVLLAGCVSSSSGNSSGIKVKELRITSTAIDVVVNETLLITAEALYDDNTKSSNGGI